MDATTNSGGINGGVGGGDSYEARGLFCVSVPNVEAALEKAENIGGRRRIGPEGTPGTLVTGVIRTRSVVASAVVRTRGIGRVDRLLCVCTTGCRLLAPISRSPRRAKHVCARGGVRRAPTRRAGWRRPETVRTRDAG